MAALTSSFFQTILKMEGGYQNMADDNGNYACGQLIGTNMGVSAVALSQWWGRCPTVAEMKALDKQTAFNFYAWYFNQYGLYRVENQLFAELLMNNTMGSPAGAARAEQRALNRMGYNLAVDGVRGPATIAALNDAWRRSPATIYNLVREEWINHLQSINKPQFLQGWLRRMNDNFPPMVIASFSAGTIFLLLLVLYYGTKS